MNKLSIDDIDLKGKRVLVRVDFNVPLDEYKKITDDKRITASLPTINKIINDGGKAILMSHLGRPKGERKPEFSLEPVAKRLTELISKNVIFSNDCIGNDTKLIVDNLKNSDVLLLENLRFHKEEEKNDPIFAKALSEFGNVFVNDAFGTAHRAHASTEGITKFIFPCVAGYLMKKELDYLGSKLENPLKPYCAILGGAKISGKIDVIKNLIGKVDTLIVGGGMAFTFFKAQDKEIGISLLEEDKLELAKEILSEIEKSNTKLFLPIDVLMADKYSNKSAFQIVSIENMPSNQMGLDIGPESIKLFSEQILDSKTIVWNGPMGVFEFKNFSNGTFSIAEALKLATENGSVTIVGGGDSAAAIKEAGLDESVSHVSTGGGASLEFLEGKLLPGVEALTSK
ncbi:MAG: phosphoglycerate kinase [Ignavibacteriales bacterium CG_4_9_14_3_um_filter_30_11]|nr:MAG: phosphoglycerate kinase [Ignavibacteriales bacterium CG_4_9_14_3_um_filter_30_11]